MSGYPRILVLMFIAIRYRKLAPRTIYSKYSSVQPRVGRFILRIETHTSIIICTDNVSIKRENAITITTGGAISCRRTAPSPPRRRRFSFSPPGNAPSAHRGCADLAVRRVASGASRRAARDSWWPPHEAPCCASRRRRSGLSVRAAAGRRRRACAVRRRYGAPSRRRRRHER